MERTWTLEEIADACYMTPGELSKWISRRLYRPSQRDVPPGQRRRFDWRDLVCLSVIAALRPHCLSINIMGLLVGEIRDMELDAMDEFPESPRLILFSARWPGDRWPEHEWRFGDRETIGLFAAEKMPGVLRCRPNSLICVDVSHAYREALARLEGAGV